MRASSPGGAGMREGKGEDLIGQILTTQHQRSRRGFWGFPFSLPLAHPHSPGRACSQAICRSKNALRGKYRHRTLDAFLLSKGKEREGFIKRNWCGRVLRLVYYLTIKLTKNIERLSFFFFFCKGSCLHVASACMRYRRRINDISPGLVMFSNIYVH